ncbi:MAG: cysteine--tRNA ligase [Coriobacteriales bacterium]|jgi:cysteinyl-tRNA synthetase|nr:cysteine--tRNA ligase [Coriobacteriales bacterium]
MKLYNTLTRRKEDFVPLKPGKVGIYICGPTVYNHIHIGNARTFLSFDVIRRYFAWSGYAVTYVQNITDVDDKIINRASDENRTAAEVAAEYTEAFIAGMEALGIEAPSIRPKATEEIPAMIELISGLVEKGNAYEADGDVYFAVRSYPDYGKLSGRDIDAMKSGARVEVDTRKRDPLDFALWKAAKLGEPSWASPWGEGRPGWHIECSAMSARYLGNPFDIHAGGDDLAFPHHENEIAQSEACFDSAFANYWLHGGMLTIDHEKMSKSEGNFLLLKDVLGHVRPAALRLLMLQTHYRSPFDYSAERLDEATAALERIESAVRNMRWAVENYEGGVGAAADDAAANDASLASAETLRTQMATTREQFKTFMDDDFNTAGAVAGIYELVTAGNTCIAAGLKTAEAAAAVGEAVDTITELLSVLGVNLDTVVASEEALPAELVELAAQLTTYAGTGISEALAALLEARQNARATKDWATADAVRDGLAALGITVEDTPSGPRIVRG